MQNLNEVVPKDNSLNEVMPKKQNQVLADRFDDASKSEDPQNALKEIGKSLTKEDRITLAEAGIV